MMGILLLRVRLKLLEEDIMILFVLLLEVISTFSVFAYQVNFLLLFMLLDKSNALPVTLLVFQCRELVIAPVE